MKSLRSQITRTTVALGVMGTCLAFTPANAEAAFLDFTVVESLVPGVPAGAPDLNVDKMSGTYVETLTLGAGNTFTATARATFTAYNQDGPAVTSYLSAFPGAEAYRIYSDFTATGTYTDGVCNTSGGPVACRTFTATGGNATTYVDPNSTPDGDDILLLTSSNILPGSGGVIFTGTVPNTGNFNFVFGTNVLSAFGDGYWPTLSTVIFSATVNGDFDEITGVNPQQITGDLSVQFTAVPEPASMTLLGIGLLGAGLAARRRRS